MNKIIVKIQEELDKIKIMAVIKHKIIRYGEESEHEFVFNEKDVFEIEKTYDNGKYKVKYIKCPVCKRDIEL